MRSVSLAASSAIFICLASHCPTQQRGHVAFSSASSITVMINSGARQGSGFLTSKNYVLTCYHVVQQDPNQVQIIFDSSYTLDNCKVIWSNPDLDLAIVALPRPVNRTPPRISLSGSTDQASDLGPFGAIVGKPPISLYGSAVQGQKIYVVGSPDGLTNTISDGIVSGTRSETRADNTVRELVQFTAPIGPGSSGGPLLRTDGTIIGVVKGTVSQGQQLNFAIPIPYDLNPYVQRPEPLLEDDAYALMCEQFDKKTKGSKYSKLFTWWRRIPNDGLNHKKHRLLRIDIYGYERTVEWFPKRSPSRAEMKTIFDFIVDHEPIVP